MFHRLIEQFYLGGPEGHESRKRNHCDDEKTEVGPVDWDKYRKAKAKASTDAELWDVIEHPKGWAESYVKEFILELARRLDEHR